MMDEEKELMWQMERSELQQTIEVLKKEIQTMQEELSMFQKDKCNKQNTPSEEVMEYHTDEEELNQETEWILKKNKKRRRHASLEMSSRQQKVDETEQDKQSNVQKKVRPPPIIVGKVQNYEKMDNHVKKNNISNFQTVLLNSGEIKINAEEEKDNRDITRALKQTNIEWYSFENKLTRPIKVMARNIHASFSAEDVMKDLQNKNFAIMDVSQIRSRKDKTLLPLYMLTFEKKRGHKKDLGNKRDT
jgi:hypothetical protein